MHAHAPAEDGPIAAPNYPRHSLHAYPSTLQGDGERSSALAQHPRGPDHLQGGCEEGRLFLAAFVFALMWFAFRQLDRSWFVADQA